MIQTRSLKEWITYLLDKIKVHDDKLNNHLIRVKSNTISVTLESTKGMATYFELDIPNGYKILDVGGFSTGMEWFVVTAFIVHDEKTLRLDVHNVSYSTETGDMYVTAILCKI